MDIVQKLMGAPIFFQLLLFTGFIAFGLLSLDQGVQDLSFEIVQSMSCLLVQLYLNFRFCYHADNMARRTSSIANIVYNSHWYLIPVEQSRMLALIMRRAQVPFVLNGFQLFHCSLQSFQSVSCWNYFVILSCVVKWMPFSFVHSLLRIRCLFFLSFVNSGASIDSLRRKHCSDIIGFNWNFNQITYYRLLFIIINCQPTRNRTSLFCQRLTSGDTYTYFGFFKIDLNDDKKFIKQFNEFHVSCFIHHLESVDGLISKLKACFLHWNRYLLLTMRDCRGRNWIFWILNLMWCSWAKLVEMRLMMRFKTPILQTKYILIEWDNLTTPNILVNNFQGVPKSMDIAYRSTHGTLP